MPKANAPVVPGALGAGARARIAAASTVLLEPVRDNTGRVVGRIVREGGVVMLVKHNLDPQVHHLQRPPAWATDTIHLERLEAFGGRFIRLRMITGEVLEAALSDFMRYGLEIDRGHGQQFALADRYWRVLPPPGAPRQLSLPWEVTP
jgi:hypothetical protein